MALEVSGAGVRVSPPPTSHSSGDSKRFKLMPERADNFQLEGKRKEDMMIGSKCKVCMSAVVRGASRCALCGSKHGIPILHVAFLGASAALISSLFVMAGRAPSEAELEYHPPRQPRPEATSTTESLPPSLSSPPRPGRW